MWEREVKGWFVGRVHGEEEIKDRFENWHGDLKVKGWFVCGVPRKGEVKGRFERRGE
jgi:hypothetical protein